MTALRSFAARHPGMYEALAVLAAAVAWALLL